MAISTLSKFTVPLANDQSSASQGLLMPKLQYRFRAILENFGGDLAEVIMKDITNIKQYREKLRNLFFGQSKLQGHISPLFTSCIATTLMGAGECQDLSFRHALEMLKTNNNDFLIIFGRNPERDFQKGTHAFILTKASKILNKRGTITGMLFSSFMNSLPSDCLLIDPLLNYIGTVKLILSNDMNDTISSYYSSMAMSQIYQCVQFSSNDLTLSNKIDQQAQDLIQSLQRTKLLQYSNYREYNYTNLKQSIMKLKNCKHPKVFTAMSKPKQSHKNNQSV